MARKRPLTESSRAAVIIFCRACLGFVGYSNRKCIVYCSDICRLTRDWAWADEDLSDMVMYLHEQEGIPLAQVARLLDRSGYWNSNDRMTPELAQNIYRNRKVRKIYSPG